MDSPKMNTEAQRRIDEILDEMVDDDERHPRFPDGTRGRTEYKVPFDQWWYGNYPPIPMTPRRVDPYMAAKAAWNCQLMMSASEITRLQQENERLLEGDKVARKFIAQNNPLTTQILKDTVGRLRRLLKTHGYSEQGIDSFLRNDAESDRLMAEADELLNQHEDDSAKEGDRGGGDG